VVVVTVLETVTVVGDVVTVVTGSVVVVVVVVVVVGSLTVTCDEFDVVTWVVSPAEPTEVTVLVVTPETSATMNASATPAMNATTAASHGHDEPPRPPKLWPHDGQ
jgi:hypothetical protein